ncbi:hypothetical protein PU73_18815 [Escherichia coli]|nr:hypothetical protein PU73_18815 [Escherichia coli]
MISAVRKKYVSMLRVVTSPHSLNPPRAGFLWLKSVLYSKRAGGGEYMSFSLLAFLTRVIGVSR